MIYLDIIIIMLLVIGFIEGWKKGMLTSAVNLVASILIFVLAFILKGPISLILISHFPFLKFNGIFAGITSFNILLYEAIAFFILTILITIAFKLLLKLTGIFNKVINATIILGLPNKLLGSLINTVRYVIISFIIIFILSMIPATSHFVNESKVSKGLLNGTPILSSATKDINHSIKEIYNLVKKLDSDVPKDEINKETMEILLKYDIINKETAINLHKEGKLDIAEFDELIENKR